MQAKEKKGSKPKIKPEELGVSLLTFVMGLPPLTSGINPFALSLLCATTKNKIYIFGACLVSSLFCERKLLNIISAILVLFISRHTAKKGSKLSHRILTSCAVSALFGINIIASGISTFAELLVLFAALFSFPVCTLAFSLYSDKKDCIILKKQEFINDAVTCIVIYAVTKTFGIFELGGVPFSFAAGVLITLYFAKVKGFLYGGISGLICGMASGVPAIAALSIVGIVYGLIEPGNPIFASVLTFMISISAYAYLSGTDGLIAAAFMLAATISVFFPIRKRLPDRGSIFNLDAIEPAESLSMKKFAAAFSSMSGVFYTVSDDKASESITETANKVRETVAVHCERCKGCGLDCSELCNFLTSEIKFAGNVSMARMPDCYKEECRQIESITAAVSMIAYARENIKEKGLKSLADEYQSISSLLNTAADKQVGSMFDDKETAMRIFSLLKEKNIDCEKVRVTGSRIKIIEVFGIKMNKLSISSNELCSLISKLVKLRLSTPEFIVNDEYVIMRLSTIPRIHVEYSHSTLAKNGEKVCGDTVSFFENDEKYFYCLLSDGMGSGRDAALTSRLSALMLEKLFTIGADKTDALQMVNKMLAKKNEEVFATLDILELDRVSGQASIIKAGAAPTYLIRDDKAHRIESKTPPAGIMREVIAEKISIGVKKGDYILMVSDGVMTCAENDGDLISLLEKGKPKNASSLVSRVMDEARQYDGMDDMSVCAIRLY